MQERLFAYNQLLQLQKHRTAGTVNIQKLNEFSTDYSLQDLTKKLEYTKGAYNMTANTKY